MLTHEQLMIQICVMLKSWRLDKIAEHKLTSRKYKEIKSLMDMLYDFAIELNLTNSNVSRWFMVFLIKNIFSMS